ncbi:MAG: H+/Na+-translocating ferredoxin:NAD+ oxidoreductase subunit [Verrucomicrobiota bacterium]|jgi:electron transport complex protein RnfG|nr:H+/Na+-translocating ferredoxin:NAD+ oxidoreductase subunit [Verrucomicrobiota bacterium]MDK2963008.1 H+/Na+-translocating ferredoxin:NAD+ oxidoreductase subunit [Verrucomicrobiota bacterium]
MSNGNVKITPLVLSLGIISCVAAVLLAWVYLITEEPIAAAMQQKTNAALNEVLPAFDNQPAEETVIVGEVKFYVGRKEGQIIGFAGETVSHKGYGGDVTVLAGLKPDGTVTTVLVTKQTETPGLGTVVAERKREKTLSGLISGKKETGLPPNRILDQFNGMKAEAGQAPWAVKKDGGTLDAVTGATITSRAVCGAVFTIAETFAQNRETLLKEKN